MNDLDKFNVIETAKKFVDYMPFHQLTRYLCDVYGLEWEEAEKYARWVIQNKIRSAFGIEEEE